MGKRGKLRVFFGYSAGVGKTYSMLKAAHELKAQGVDVVLGYFEPHERIDTINMSKGFEILPLKEISYRGILLKEFDVDSAIQRRPQLLLVDELAHTNAPGSKNRKRYLDVEELLNSGIDVWTTVNVQHIEGLHDIVDGATSVDVSERVPDEIFDYANEVSLVDIEPTELIERMREGKIYKKNRAYTALENFFREDNLSSLRELSMRRSADRIEKLSHNGTLKTKVLVLISPSPSSQKNIRVAARMAEAYHCKFSAMYVETNGELSDEAAMCLKQHVSLVENLGGELVVKYGDDIVEIVADYVKLSGTTNLILGKTWQSVGKKVGLEDKFIARLKNIEVLIVPDNQYVSNKKSSLKDLLRKVINGKKARLKFDTANKTLDIISLLVSARFENNYVKSVAEILSTAFARSCTIYNQRYRETVSYQQEDTRFFDSEKEIAVLEWCKKNLKIAGTGTDTLREVEAIYFPIKTYENLSVIAFSCKNSKMTVTEKFIFHQLQNVLKLILLC